VNEIVPDQALRRRAAHLRGHRAEWLAMAALLLKGYWPIGRRPRTIVFVEVKARSSLDEARVAIDAAKKRRFSRAVRAWIGRNPWCAGMTLRADAVFVGPGEWPVHLPAVFTIEGL
jgi:putative endonuclease